jgi:hypothetical protein
MKTHYRNLLFSAIIIIGLVGCGSRVSGGFAADEELVEDTTVSRQVQYLDATDDGPVYTFTVDVPQDWVDQFATNNSGNTVTFEYITDDEGGRAAIFEIQALSFAQFWEQNGSYPGTFQNIKATAETYFVVNVPVFAYYSGLPEDEYEAFTAAVPDIVASFDVLEGVRP